MISYHDVLGCQSTHVFANKQLSIFTLGLDNGQNGFCCNRPFQSNQLFSHRVFGSTKLCYFALIPYFQLYIGSYCTFSRLKCQLVERINHGALSFLFPLIYCFSFIANISLCQKRTIQFPFKFRLFIIQYYSLVDFLQLRYPDFISSAVSFWQRKYAERGYYDFSC